MEDVDNITISKDEYEKLLVCSKTVKSLVNLSKVNFLDLEHIGLYTKKILFENGLFKKEKQKMKIKFNIDLEYSRVHANCNGQKNSTETYEDVIYSRDDFRDVDELINDFMLYLGSPGILVLRDTNDNIIVLNMNHISDMVIHDIEVIE